MQTNPDKEIKNKSEGKYTVNIEDGINAFLFIILLFSLN